MLKEIVGIDKKFERFPIRFISAIKGHFLILSGIMAYLGIVYGWNVSLFGLISVVLLLLMLYGWYKASSVLYELSVDEELGTVEIQTLHYNTVKVNVFERKQVKVNVLMDATSRYNVDMIRLDVDRKTYYKQKQTGPWTYEKIEQTKNFPK